MVAVDGHWCFCRICSPTDDGDGWDDGERKLVKDIERHGWGVVGVAADDEIPGWAYTVGLWHSSRSPEVAMFGLRVEDMQSWLNELGETVRGGRALSPEPRSDIIDGFDVHLRPVHESWYRELFGFALWFTAPPLPIVQVVWPDRHGRMPWESEVGEACRRDQPSCDQPIGDQPAG